jgi:hypothetical protein
VMIAGKKAYFAAQFRDLWLIVHTLRRTARAKFYYDYVERYNIFTYMPWSGLC